MNQKIELLKVRDMGEIVSTAVEFTRENFKKLFKCVAFIALPLYLAGSIMYSLALSRTLRSSFENEMGMAPQMEFAGTNMFIALFLYFLGSLVLISTVTEYMRLYRERGYDGFDINDVWNGVLQSFFKIFFSSILLYALILLGFLFFILPGIYLLVPFMIVFPVLINERENVFSGIERAFRLTRGRWWRSFGTIFVSMIIINIIVSLLALPVGVALWFLVFDDINAATGNMGTIFSTMYSFIFLLGFFVAIFFQVVINVLYFSLKEEKDKTSLLEKINAIGTDSNHHQDTEEQY